MKRCDWVSGDLHTKYHDTEWGTLLHDDRKLFEFLVLDGMQSGLSWQIVLRKRQSFRKAFDNFNAKKFLTMMRVTSKDCLMTRELSEIGERLSL